MALTEVSALLCDISLIHCFTMYFLFIRPYCSGMYCMAAKYVVHEYHLLVLDMEME